MDTAFLTGGTGFVGANLARLLVAKGLKVRALARKGSSRKSLEGVPVEFIEGDLADARALETGCRGARTLFHVAADYRIWVPDPAAMMAANVDGTRRILEAAGKAGVERIVHCSSVAAVRLRPDGSAADESSLYESAADIIGHYKRSKWLSELEALAAAKRGLPVVVVNPAAPIGPWDAKPTPTGRIVTEFLNRRMPSYIETGLNVVHVRDVAEGHWLAAVNGRVGERYILGGENLTLKAILDLLEEETGIPGPRFKAPYAVALAFAALDTLRARAFGGEPMAPLDAVRMAGYKMYFDSGKARRELGYSPAPARQALRDAAEWFLEHGYVADPDDARAALGRLAARRASPAPEAVAAR